MLIKAYFHTINKKPKILKENCQLKIKNRKVNSLQKMMKNTVVCSKKQKKKINWILTQNAVEDLKTNMAVQCYRILAVHQVSQS